VSERERENFENDQDGHEIVDEEDALVGAAHEAEDPCQDGRRVDDEEEGVDCRERGLTS